MKIKLRYMIYIVFVIIAISTLLLLKVTLSASIIASDKYYNPPSYNIGLYIWKSDYSNNYGWAIYNYGDKAASVMCFDYCTAATYTWTIGGYGNKVSYSVNIDPSKCQVYQVTCDIYTPDWVTYLGKVTVKYTFSKPCSENCDAKDGWYCVTDSKREYRDYYCNWGVCSYKVTKVDYCPSGYKCENGECVKQNPSIFNWIINIFTLNR